MLRRMTKEERIDQDNKRDRRHMEEILAEVATLRNAGYTARIGWTDHSEYTGTVAQVLCTDDAVSACGVWLQPIHHMLGGTACEQCYADRMERAGA